MKVAFALFLVIVLIVAALQADARHMNLQGRQLADASMGHKAIVGSSDATVSSTSGATTTPSKITDSKSTTSTSTTAATNTGVTDAKTGPPREKNDSYNNYSSTPADSDNDSSHHVITGRS